MESIVFLDQVNTLALYTDIIILFFLILAESFVFFKLKFKMD